MQGVCASLLGEGPAVLIFKRTCPRGDVPAECRGMGLDISSSGLHWGVVCCLLKSVSVDGWARGGWNGDRPLLPILGSSCRSVLRLPLQKNKQSPLFCPWLPSDFCLYPVCTAFLPGGTVLMSFISGLWLGFKTSNFRDPHDSDLH